MGLIVRLFGEKTQEGNYINKYKFQSQLPSPSYQVPILNKKRFLFMYKKASYPDVDKRLKII